MLKNKIFILSCLAFLIVIVLIIVDLKGEDSSATTADLNASIEQNQEDSSLSQGDFASAVLDEPENQPTTPNQASFLESLSQVTLADMYDRNFEAATFGNEDAQYVLYYIYQKCSTVASAEDVEAVKSLNNLPSPAFTYEIASRDRNECLDVQDRFRRDHQLSFEGLSQRQIETELMAAFQNEAKNLKRQLTRNEYPLLMELALLNVIKIQNPDELRSVIKSGFDYPYPELKPVYELVFPAVQQLYQLPETNDEIRLTAWVLMWCSLVYRCDKAEEESSLQLEKFDRLRYAEIKKMEEQLTAAIREKRWDDLGI